MRTVGNPGVEPPRAEPSKARPGPAVPRDERRPVEPPASGPDQGLPPFLRALLRALSVWST